MNEPTGPLNAFSRVPLEWVNTPFEAGSVRVAVTTAMAEPVELGAAPFNLGLNVADDPARVQARRRWVEQQVQSPVIWLTQVHGTDLLEVSTPLPDAPQCAGKDGAVTTRTDVALSVLTADCLPAVFYAPGAIGVAHAGWRGLASGVLQKTASEVARLAHVPVSEVQVWLGPAIGPQSFEVGQDVVNAFQAQEFTAHPRNSPLALTPRTIAGKWSADLYTLARLSLASYTTRVSGGGADTFTEPMWFSHRASAQTPGRTVGRFATLIQLLQ